MYTIVGAKPDIARNLVEGINIFGEGHWADIRSAYDFAHSKRYLYRKWKKLKDSGKVIFEDKRWILTDGKESNVSSAQDATQDSGGGASNGW